MELESGAAVIVSVDTERMRLASRVSVTGGEIFIPYSDYFPSGSVLHELLHIRRFLVCGMPRLTRNEDYEQSPPDEIRTANAITHHDNSFEHLLIVPDEIRYYPERREYWIEHMRQRWQELENDEIEAADRRQAMLAHWVFVQHVFPDDDVLKYARSVTERFSLSGAAQRFHEQLIPCLLNKVAAMRLWFEHMQIPLEMASLEYIDSRNVTSRRVPLAQG